MMLTTKGRYAVMSILELATKSSGMPVTLGEISLKQNIPISYLEQIFLMLRKAALVKSVKGPKGGYVINSPLDELRIASIIDAVNENIEMTRCGTKAMNNCMPNNTKCNTHYLWYGLSNHIRNYLEAISVADVMTMGKDLPNIKNI